MVSSYQSFGSDHLSLLGKVMTQLFYFIGTHLLENCYGINTLQAMSLKLKTVKINS